MALGVTGGDNVTEKNYKMPKLDEHAQDLISRTNFSEEDIKDALSDTSITKYNWREEYEKCLSPPCESIPEKALVKLT